MLETFKGPILQTFCFVLLLAATATSSSLSNEIRMVNQCPQGLYYDYSSEKCQGMMSLRQVLECDPKCQDCSSTTSCLNCADRKMALQLDGSCHCLHGFTFDPIIRRCVQNTILKNAIIFGNESSKSESEIRYQQIQVSNNEKETALFLDKKRKLTSVTTQTTIGSANTTYSSTNFVLAAGTLASTDYFFVVNSSTPTSNQVIIFDSCTFDIAGNFLISTRPVQIEFHNCIFNIGSTTQLLNLNYSSNCSSSDILQGNLIITDSIFQDGSTTSSLGSPILASLVTASDILISNVTFLALSNSYTFIIEDVQCAYPLSQAQVINITELVMNNSNVQFEFSFPDLPNVSSQLQLYLTSSQYYNISSKCFDLKFQSFKQHAQYGLTFFSTSHRDSKPDCKLDQWIKYQLFQLLHPRFYFCT